jgi:acetyl esterase/lipase
MRAASLFVAFCCALMLWSGVPRSDELSPVGMRQLEFRDADRELSLTLYYPAAPADDADLFTMPFYTGVALHRDAPLLDPQAKRPLVMFSHGRGSNALTYAWFGQYLAARGFIVAALDHYRANSYDATIAYLANKLWQRPKDLSLAITFLLQHPDSGPTVDRERIGVAGHSQGGFTALWVGGATVNPDKYLVFKPGGRTTGWCRPICGAICRSIPGLPSMSTISASRLPSPWRRESSRLSAWMNWV